MSRQSTVQQLLQRLRSLDDDPNGKPTKDQTEQMMRRAGQHTLQIPRRGCVEEYSSLLQKLQRLAGVPEEERAPAREALLNVQAAEQWREAECLALRPHSMHRLKALPELRQIISHTCLDAAHAAAGSMTQHLVEYAAQKFHQQWKQEGAYGRDSTGSGEDSTPRLTDYVSPEKLYALNHQRKDASLLAHLSPGLRLCLAAEVAVGMLCAGQPPPPDTPKHAAALQMFVVEAWKHVDAELQHTPNEPGQLPANLPAAVEDICLGMRRSRQQSTAGQRFFAAGEASSSPLAPHLDLQLQLPPQQLLQLLKEAGKLLPLQQQDDEAASGLSEAGNVVQQQQGEEDGSLPFDVSSLHPQCQACIAELLYDWQLAIQWTESSNSSSSSGRAEEGECRVRRADWLIGRLQAQCHALLDVLQGIQAPAEPAVVTQQQQLQQPDECATAVQSEEQQGKREGLQQQQQPVKHQHGDHGALRDTTNQQQQQQQQHAVNRSFVKITAVLTDSDDETSSITSGSGCVEVDGPEICSSSLPGSDIYKAGLQADERHNTPLLIARDFMTLGKCLVLSLIQQAWESGGGAAAAAAWQQAVPLQVLLLCGQLQQLEAALDRWARSAERLLQQQQHAEQQQQHAEQQQQHAEQQQQHAEQQQQHALAEEHKEQQLKLLQHVVAFVQGVRQFKQASEAINSAAETQAAAPAAITAAAAGAAPDATSSSSSSSSRVQPLPPCSFFSAGGPLSGGLLGLSQPAGAGLWAPAEPATAHQQQQQQDLVPLLQQQACAVLFGSCAWQQARELAAEAVASDFKEAPTVTRDAIYEQLDDLCHSDWMQNAPAEHRRKAEAYVKRFEELGLDDDALIATVREVFMLAPATAQHLTARHLAWLDVLGFDSTVWQRHAARAATDAAARERQANQAQADARFYRLRLQLRDGDRLQHAAIGDGLAQIIDGLEERRLAAAEQGMLELDSEDQLQLIYINWQQQQQQQQQQQGMAGEVTDPGANGIAASLAAAAAAGGGAEGGWDVVAAVSAADAALRQFALRCSVLFSPLITWYGGWLRQHDLLVRQSRGWWCSKARCKLAADGCRGIKPAPTSGTAAAAAAAAAGAKKASCGGSCNEEWPSGGYDFNASCPLCQHEQQQQQQLGSEAVAHTDPFMWRRLLWLLLGKLSPGSQEFYAQYAAACPHCPDPEVWTMVRSSLLNSLWSSPAADVIEQQLSRPCHISVGGNAERGDRLQLYARALNTSFEQGSHQANTLLAQHLLLALSPLHAQLLPRPETAFLCPSSFPAAVGKALAGQLLSRPVLDCFQHSMAHLTMWHVHWHIGLRRYGSARKQQQQAGLTAKQQLHAAAAAAAAAGQGSGLYAELTVAELDQLYLDPDAKVAAVYYASRQLSGAPNSALCSSSSSRLNGLGLAQDTARAAESALDAASRCVDELRWSFLQHAAREYYKYDQNDPETGESLLSQQDQQLLQDLKQLIDSVQQDLRWQDERVLLPGLLQASAHELLQPAGLRQLQQQVNLTPQNGRDVAADMTVQHMERLWRSGRESNGGLGLCDGPAHLAGRLHDKAGDMELEWQQWPLRVVQPTTDIQEAAMQPPVPLEALLTPAVWSCRQQQLLDRANSCDACGKVAQLKTCASCDVALYCSFSCFQEDAKRHGHICSQLARAAKRHSPRTLSCKPSSAALQPLGSSSRVSSWDALVAPVKDCFEGEPWGLCSSAGAALDQLPVGVVPAELYMEQCRRTLNQILHEAPDTATDSLDAAGSSSSSRRRSPYKNAWVDPWNGYGF